MLSVYSCIYKGLIGAKPSPTYNVDNERVVGGQNAEPNKWKWQASNCFPCSARNILKKIELTSSGIFWVIFPLQISLQLGSYGYFAHICGGTIIDGFHIMTAAHCILRLVLSVVFKATRMYISDPFVIDDFTLSLLPPSVQTPVITESWQVNTTWMRLKAVNRSFLWKGLLSILGGTMTLATGIKTTNCAIFYLCNHHLNFTMYLF